MALHRKKVCTVCSTEYTASQISSKFCSESCKTADKLSKQKARRLKIASKRMEKLAVSEEWLWVARECKRAGTVEILHSHTAESLETLFALRNYKYRCYGWDSERGVSKFDLCHIQPVSGESTIGLLHPLNLFVGSSLPNKVHGTLSYSGVGLSIRRLDLQSKWLVDKKDSDKKVLGKVQRYLGPVLREYAVNNPIRTSQRFGLAKWVYRNDPQQRFSLSDLEKKSMTELRKLRAEIEEREVYKLDLTAKRSLLVYFDECCRFADILPEGKHRQDCAFLIDVLRVAAATLSLSYGEDGFQPIISVPAAAKWAPASIRDYTEERFSSFRDWLGFTAFQTLHGRPLVHSEVLSTLRRYLQVEELLPTFGEYHRELNVTFLQSGKFGQDVKLLQNSLLKLGLLEGAQEFELLDLCKRANDELNTTVAWLSMYQSCGGVYDYSTICYEVQDDYTTDPLGDEAYTYINHAVGQHEAIKKVSFFF